LDKLKQAIRPFNIRYTKERLIEFDNELSELTRQKQEFSKSLDDLKSMVENKGEVDEMQALLMPSAFLYPKAVLASSIRFFAVFNNLSLSSVNSFNFSLKEGKNKNFQNLWTT
jgi:hypothetical protein